MILPKNIEEIFYKAKKYYPELDNISIKLKYTPLFYETMTATPSIYSFLFPWKKRSYVISINSGKQFGRYNVPISSFNDSILLGWFGHELAHLIQYEKMDWLEIMFLPYNFIFNQQFRKKFELEADKITKERGLEKELIKGIKFILEDQRVNRLYKEKTKKYYSQVS